MVCAVDSCTGFEADDIGCAGTFGRDVPTGACEAIGCEAEDTSCGVDEIGCEVDGCTGCETDDISCGMA
jgi:hypothetical protein